MMRVAVFFPNTSLCLFVFVHPVIRGASVWPSPRKSERQSCRNRVKRVLRECFRLHQALLPPAVDLVIVPKRHLKPEQLDLAAATREFLPLIKEIGGYVVLRREQNACPDISRDGIAAPGGLEPETASGVKA